MTKAYHAISFLKRYYYISIYVCIDLIINLIQIFSVSLSPEENYFYITYAQHLDWSYLEQPPMLALCIKAGTLLFGTNPFGLRIFGILSLFGSKIILCALLGTHEKKKAQLYLVMSLIGIPIFSVLQLYTSEYLPLLFFWCVALFYYQKRLNVTYSNNDCILLSLAFAGMIYSSYWGWLLVSCMMLSLGRLWNKKDFLNAFLVLLLAIPQLLYFWVHRNLFASYVVVSPSWSFIYSPQVLLFLLFLLNPLVLLLVCMALPSALKSTHLFVNKMAILFVVVFSFLFVYGFLKGLPSRALVCVAVPLFILFVYQRVLFPRISVYFNTTLIVCVGLIIGLRTFGRFHERLLQSHTSRYINQKQALFYQELFKNEHIGFIQSACNASLYSYYTAQESFCVPFFCEQVNSYNIFYPPSQWNHKRVIFINSTTRNPNPLFWDTIFYKYQNVYYKIVDNFISWQDCTIDSFSFVRVSDTSVCLRVSLLTPSSIGLKDLTKIQFAWIEKIAQHIQWLHTFLPQEITPMGLNQYRVVSKPIALRTVSKLLESRTPTSLLGFSLVQDGDLYYFNSRLLPALTFRL